MQITQVYLDNVPGPDQAGLAELELGPRRAGPSLCSVYMFETVRGCQ